MKVSTISEKELRNNFLLECEGLGIVPSADYLIVSIERQELYHYCGGDLVGRYFVSTSEKEPSCMPGSLGTPWGMHRVEARIGDGEELGMVFKGRKATGKRYWEGGDEFSEEERLVTTRILWLKGLEEGVNWGEGVDSYERCIYIHGTNREDLLGRRASHGCIVLSNRDMMVLYDRVGCGSLVWIMKGG